MDLWQITKKKETDQRGRNILPTPIADTEERNSKVYYHSRGLTNIPSLPEELVFDILLHLAPQDIYNGARFVCKKWYNIIHSRNFIREHLRHSTHGLLFQCGSQVKQPIVVSMRRGRIEISKFNHEFKDFYCSGCDGLFLHHDYNHDALYITHPATNRQFPLPVTPHICCSLIAYDAASMVYKVILTFYHFKNLPKERDCAILTVGVDKSWRHVHTQHLSLASRKLLLWIPLNVEGFVHWTNIPGGTHVVTLNVETEVITETHVPVEYGPETLKYYLSTGTSLTLLIECSEFSWEFWNLEPKTGEWTKLPNIDLEPQKGKLVNLVIEHRRRCFCPFNLRPVGWLNHGEVLVLHGSPFTRVCVLYNVRTQEIDFFELDYECNSHRFNSYRDSLVSLA